MTKDIAQPTIELLTKALVNAMADQVKRRAYFEKAMQRASAEGDRNMVNNCTKSIDALNRRISESAMALQVSGVRDVTKLLDRIQASIEPPKPKPKDNVVQLFHPYM
jgi:small-conductance mechanosensitive channel